MPQFKTKQESFPFRGLGLPVWEQFGDPIKNQMSSSSNCRNDRFHYILSISNIYNIFYTIYVLFLKKIGKRGTSYVFLLDLGTMCEQVT